MERGISAPSERRKPWIELHLNPDRCKTRWGAKRTRAVEERSGLQELDRAPCWTRRLWERLHGASLLRLDRKTYSLVTFLNLRDVERFSFVYIHAFAWLQVTVNAKTFSHIYVCILWGREWMSDNRILLLTTPWLQRLFYYIVPDVFMRLWTLRAVVAVIPNCMLNLKMNCFLSNAEILLSKRKAGLI